MTIVTRPALIEHAEPSELEDELAENDDPHNTGIQSLRITLSGCALVYCDVVKIHLREQPIVFGQNMRM